MVDGWSLDEMTGEVTYVWSEGPKSVLAMNLPTGNDLTMKFECRPFVFPDSSPQSIDVHLNGESIADLHLQSDRNEYSVTLSKSLLSSDPDTANILEFKYAHTDCPADVLPGSHDTRDLAVCWYRLSIAGPVDDAAVENER